MEPFRLAVSGATIFAGSYLGVLRSSDGGLTWTIVNNGFTAATPAVYALAAVDSMIFAGTAEGVYRSLDNGGVWMQVNDGLVNQLTDHGEQIVPIPPRITALTIAGTTIYIGIEYHGVYRSLDRGSTWERMTMPSQGLTVKAFAASGTDLYAGTADVSRHGAVLVLAEKSTQWTSVSSGLIMSAVASLVASGPHIYAGTGGGGVYYTHNRGMSWSNSGSGMSWSNSGSGMMNANVNAFLVRGSELIAGIDGAGIFRSTDEGVSQLFARGEGDRTLRRNGSWRLSFVGQRGTLVAGE